MQKLKEKRLQASRDAHAKGNVAETNGWVASERSNPEPLPAENVDEIPDAVYDDGDDLMEDPFLKKVVSFDLLVKLGPCQ